eukprot:SAG31_NODE_2223_length_6152_cov_4.129688_3_plen_236_part_00
MQRRTLYNKLQRGWGTHYHPGMLSWVLLPESFAVKLGLFRLSTRAFLSPEGLTVNPGQFHRFVVRAGLHSYDSSYIEAALTWRGNASTGGDNINVSIATTVDKADSSQLTMTATVNNPSTVNASDFLLILVPAFTHGRAGSVSADRNGVRGVAAGLRTSTLNVIKGTVTPIPPPPPLPSPPSLPHTHSPPPPSQVPRPALGISLATTVVLSTNGTMTVSEVTFSFLCNYSRNTEL